MAEIKIEKKKPIWPWILLIVILIAAAIFYFMYYEQDVDDVDDVDDVTTENIDDVSYENNDFNETSNTITYEDSLERQGLTTVMTDYNTAIKDSTRIGQDMAYTKSTLKHLVKAVEIKAKQFGVTNSQEYQNLQIETEKMSTTTMTANSMEMAAPLKSTASNIVSVLESIQTKSFPTMKTEIVELRSRADAISASIDLEKQKPALTAFFEKAANILNNMNS